MRAAGAGGDSQLEDQGLCDERFFDISPDSGAGDLCPGELWIDVGHVDVLAAAEPRESELLLFVLGFSNLTGGACTGSSASFIQDNFRTEAGGVVEETGALWSVSGVDCASSPWCTTGSMSSFRRPTCAYRRSEMRGEAGGLGVRAWALRRALCCAGIALAVLITGSCQPCERDKPCLEWVNLGETYSVELLQDLGEKRNDGPPYPFGIVSARETMCGWADDLAVGNKVLLEAIGQNDVVLGDQCNDCYYVSARAVVTDSLVIETPIGASAWLGSLGMPDFSTAGQAVIRDCPVTYSIGVTPVSDFYLRTANDYVASDYVLFRRMSPDPASAEVPCSGDRGVQCWDAWAVRIRDSSGRQVTKDLAPPRGWDGGNGSGGDAAAADDGGAAP